MKLGKYTIKLEARVKHYTYGISIKKDKGKELSIALEFQYPQFFHINDWNWVNFTFFKASAEWFQALQSKGYYINGKFAFMGVVLWVDINPHYEPEELNDIFKSLGLAREGDNEDAKDQ